MPMLPIQLRRPRIAPELADRLPPGQFQTQRWPVLHHGSVPPFDHDTWDFRVFGEVERPFRCSWTEFQALPRITVNADMHCVTRWSTFDNVWEGVSAGEIVARSGVGPGANFVVFHAENSYTANIPVDVFVGSDVVLAVAHNGEPLTPEHGAPLRAIVPQRFAWKSAKWLRGIEFLIDDRPGFWENYGYHNNADPWQEERFAD